ncbi:MAG: bile acid:sodium symporter family protein [Bacteroidales bacterium]|nr:bile acid:sodium symporter family protein [Bacteroidales bacterium]MDD3430486.1 bile acid:sodium symporter family protein [Bacteroidales bacterium]MDD4360922.1 bile acid:sodium symporter family protein [Bacteroidales bacterium]MDD4429822.1 bile acid:sodium symporter family protein [Bacteroidales bacterium]
MFESLSVLDQVTINFSAAGTHLVNSILALIMFGVALDIRLGVFKEVLVKPKALITGLVSQLILLPVVTFLLIIIFHKWLTPTVSMGMILVSACPGGNISNFMTNLAKGKTELSVSMTAVNTAIAIFMTPLIFKIYGGLYVDYMAKASDNLLQPIFIPLGQMFYTIFILLGIPLTLGLLCTHFFPKFSKKISPTFRKASMALFLLIVVMAFSNNFDLFLKHIQWIFLIVLIHNGMALLTGFSFASLLRVNRKERRAITIETGIQNSGLGLALLFNPKIFPPEMAIGGMLFITAWWGIWHIVSGLGLSYSWSKKPLD